MARALKSFVVAFTFSGCGQKQPTQKNISPTAIKVIKILRTDISGGQPVEEGQILRHAMSLQETKTCTL